MRASVTEDSIRKWFSDTKGYLSANKDCAFDDIMADPIRVLNADETSFSFVQVWEGAWRERVGEYI